MYEEDELSLIKKRMCRILGDRQGTQNNIDNSCITRSYPVPKHDDTHNRREEVLPWILLEWRRTSIPEWEDKLKKAREEKNSINEEYALWMLNEILEVERDE